MKSAPGSAADALARLQALVEPGRPTVKPIEVAPVQHRINWSSWLLLLLVVMTLASPFLTYLAGTRAGRLAAAAKFEREAAEAREQVQAAESRAAAAVTAAETDFREQAASLRATFSTTNEALRRELALLEGRLAGCRVPDSIVRQQNAARRAANAAAAGIAVESVLGVAPASRGGRAAGGQPAGSPGNR